MGPPITFGTALILELVPRVFKLIINQRVLMIKLNQQYQKKKKK